ncbi:hypothetical protein PoB_005510700, partial [Plakobranchus ocellatus]
MMCGTQAKAALFVFLTYDLLLLVVVSRPCGTYGDNLHVQQEVIPADEDYDYLEYYWKYIYDTDCPDWNPTDGCGRTPARTKPPATTPSPNGPRTTPGPVDTDDRHANGHALVCTPEEVKKANCRHGGKCFALDLLDTRSAHCHCPEMWTGTQCERMDEEFFGE